MTKPESSGLAARRPAPARLPLRLDHLEPRLLLNAAAPAAAAVGITQRAAYRAPVSFLDADSDPVKVSFRGAGWADITRAVGSWSDPGDITTIVLGNTDATTQLSIRVSDRGTIKGDGTTVQSITGTGAKRLSMKDVDLIGNTVDLTGSLMELRVRNISDGSNILLDAASTDTLKIIAQNVGQVDLEFAGQLAYALVNEWAGGTIHVDSIGRFKTKTGDLGAKLQVGHDLGKLNVKQDWTGRAEIGGDLGRATVGRDVTGTLDIGGGVSRFKAVGQVSSEQVGIGGDLTRAYIYGGLASPLDVGGASRVVSIWGGATAQGRISIGGDVRSFKMRGAQNGTVEIGGYAGSVHILGASNALVQLDNSVRSLKITGGQNAQVNVGKDANRVDIRGGMNANVNVADTLKSLSVRGLSATGMLTAGAIGSARYRTDNGVQGAITTTGLKGDASTGNLNALKIWTGALQAALSISGSARSISLKGGSTAAGAVSVQGNAASLKSGADLAGAVNVGGNTNSLRVKGRLLADVSLANGLLRSLSVSQNVVDANVTAKQLGRVSVRGSIEANAGDTVIQATDTASRFYVSERATGVRGWIDSTPGSWIVFDALDGDGFESTALVA